MSNRKQDANTTAASVATAPSRHEARRRVREAADAFLAGELHVAIRQSNHEIDDHGREVLRRLSDTNQNSDRFTAAQAIVAALPTSDWSNLFADCIIAEHRARNHSNWIAESQVIVDRAKEAEKALSLVKKFLNKPNHVVPGNHDPVDEAISIVASAIRMKQRLADDHLNLFSRKRDQSAARAGGVAWIRDCLQAACERKGGNAEPRYVAAIATAALNMGEVTTDAARKAPRFIDRIDALYLRPTARSRGKKQTEHAA